MAGIRAALARIRTPLSRIGPTLARIGAALAGIRASLTGVRAPLARTHHVRSAGGQVEGEEQYQESTAHDLHECPSFVWGIDHSGQLPSARRGA